MKLKILTLVLLSFCLNNAFAISKGIENLQVAASGIYRGARPLNIDEMVELKNIGIKSIVNLQGGDPRSKLWKYVSFNEPGEQPQVIASEKSVAETLGMDFINFPLNSLSKVTLEDDRRIDQAIEFMHQRENQPVYIHCEHGKDRTGLVVALYKIKYENMDINDAYREWTSLGHDKKSRIFTGDLDPYFFEKAALIKKQLVE